eukprot:357392-Chlamydomonas_euryale.AAC.48
MQTSKSAAAAALRACCRAYLSTGWREPGKLASSYPEPVATLACSVFLWLQPVACTCCLLESPAKCSLCNTEQLRTPSPIFALMLKCDRTSSCGAARQQVWRRCWRERPGWRLMSSAWALLLLVGSTATLRSVVVAITPWLSSIRLGQRYRSYLKAKGRRLCWRHAPRHHRGEACVDGVHAALPALRTALHSTPPVPSSDNVRRTEVCPAAPFLIYWAPPPSRHFFPQVANTDTMSMMLKSSMASATRKATPVAAPRDSAFKVWQPVNNKQYETFSYLPALTSEQIARQVDYVIRNGYTPCLEFADAAYSFVSNENTVRFSGVSAVSRFNDEEDGVPWL